ncbi:MAG: hypothetical protein WCT12_27365 [Verrucomicrobiota bacterium]
MKSLWISADCRRRLRFLEATLAATRISQIEILFLARFSYHSALDETVLC